MVAKNNVYKCAQCEREFDEEVIKSWGANVCDECWNEELGACCYCGITDLKDCMNNDGCGNFICDDCYQVYLEEEEWD